jgi:hypothetical protein
LGGLGGVLGYIDKVLGLPRGSLGVDRTAAAQLDTVVDQISPWMKIEENKKSLRE